MGAGGTAAGAMAVGLPAGASAANEGICVPVWACCDWLGMEPVLIEDEEGGEGKREAPPVADRWVSAGGLDEARGCWWELEAARAEVWDVVYRGLDEDWGSKSRAWLET